MRGARGNFFYRNVANATSLLGVLPLAILFLDDGYRYVIPLIVFNNFMDDLDGVRAAKLNIRSRFGADLDNVCDAVAHVILALVVGAHFGDLVIAASAIAAGSIPRQSRGQARRPTSSCATCCSPFCWLGSSTSAPNTF